MRIVGSLTLGLSDSINMASWKSVNTGSGDGLASVQHRSTTWTNDDRVVNWTLGNKLKSNFNQNLKLSFKKIYLNIHSAKIDSLLYFALDVPEAIFIQRQFLKKKNDSFLFNENQIYIFRNEN